MIRNPVGLALPLPVLALLLSIAGCAGLGRSPQSDLAPVGEAATACRDWFAALDAAVDAAGVRDVQAVRLAGRPQLRVDRLLASFARDRVDGAAWVSWVGHARRLDAAGRRAELANLPAAARRSLPGVVGDPGADDRSAEATLRRCGERLTDDLLADPAAREAVLAAARVPDAYADWQRVIGLYPLTRFASLAGYRRWQRQLLELYRPPRSALSVSGTLRRYGPSRGPTGTVTLGGWPRDPLGLLEPDPERLERLFDAHAPLWEIDTATDDDRPGTPGWPAGASLPTVDTGRPAVYRKLSYARFGGQALVQLNYLVWFPARPPEHDGDIYAGRFDGVLLRVTLDPGGRVLLYDAIHPCGCYHLFYPSARLAARPLPEVGGEGFFVPQPAPLLGAGERVVVRLTAGGHQVARLYAARPDPSTVELLKFEYDELRSLPYGELKRSLFGTDGLVAGSERLERWFLWPLGVPSAGAVRQWGHHATAFVGKRHFDDPGLLETGFRVDE